MKTCASVLLGVAALLIAPSNIKAQYTLLPFSGAVVEQHGLSFKKIETELDGKTWISNRLPINKEFEFKVVDPVGLRSRGEQYFPGIGVTFLTPKGDTLGFVSNIFGSDTLSGIADFALKKLTLSLEFNEQSKVGDTVVLHCKFFDQIGPNYLLFNTRLLVVSPELPLEVTSVENSFTTYKGHNARSNGIEINSIECKVSDTLHARYAFLQFEGVSPLEINQLKQENWEVYAYSDTGISEKLKTADWKIIDVKTNKEDINKIDGFQIQLPADKWKPIPKYYRVIYTSKDRSKVMDAVFNARYKN